MKKTIYQQFSPKPEQVLWPQHSLSWQLKALRGSSSTAKTTSNSTESSNKENSFKPIKTSGGKQQPCSSRTEENNDLQGIFGDQKTIWSAAVLEVLGVKHQR